MTRPYRKRHLLENNIHKVKARGKPILPNPPPPPTHPQPSWAAFTSVFGAPQCDWKIKWPVKGNGTWKRVWEGMFEKNCYINVFFCFRILIIIFYFFENSKCFFLIIYRVVCFIHGFFLRKFCANWFFFFWVACVFVWRRRWAQRRNWIRLKEAFQAR